MFCSESKDLLKYCEEVIDDDRILHLIQTYIDSIFDLYLDNYLYKELYYLGKNYE